MFLSTWQHSGLLVTRSSILPITPTVIIGHVDLVMPSKLPQKKEKKGRKEKRERKERASQPQSQSSTTKKVQSSFKDKETELKGIPEAVREERRKASACLKCGKSGHTWFKCFSKSPITNSVASATKKSNRKRKESKDDEPAPKKTKVERATIALPMAPVTKSEGKKRSPSPRIFEVEDSSDAMSIY